MRLRLFFFLTAVSYIVPGCLHEKRNHTYVEVPDADIDKGRKLAVVYCQSCHELPDPALADAKTWFEGILPHMGPRLGIFRFNYQNYPFVRNLPENFYPSKPMLSSEDWKHIIDYYCSISPDSLPPQDRKQPISKGLPFFKVLKPEGQFNTPASLFVKIGHGLPGSAFLIGDAVKNTITSYDANLLMRDSVKLYGPAVDLVNPRPDAWIVCDIGLLNPNDGRLGKLISVSMNHKDRMDSLRTLFDSLRRPVQLLEADLNQDGRKDLIVCEFGNMMGALCWLEQMPDGHYTRHVLRDVPGAIRVEVNDYNHDGRPDIWCLFAQGDESIELFTNLGSGKFSGQPVLRFPPIYGSSYFELDDFNKDGFPDILYTCGDNADYSPVLKPYHGVYIFLNDGKNNFTKSWFFPVNGSYKAMAKDFDGDGDLDIATISFFPDFLHQPEESFIYLENTGGLSFKPYSFPGAAQGRWLTMDVGDIDGDGKPDILLGNFSIAPSFIHEHVDWQKQPPFLILKNQFR